MPSEVNHAYDQADECYYKRADHECGSIQPPRFRNGTELDAIAHRATARAGGVDKDSCNNQDDARKKPFNRILECALLRSVLLLHNPFCLSKNGVKRVLLCQMKQLHS